MAFSKSTNPAESFGNIFQNKSKLNPTIKPKPTIKPHPTIESNRTIIILNQKEIQHLNQCTMKLMTHDRKQAP